MMCKSKVFFFTHRVRSGHRNDRGAHWIDCCEYNPYDTFEGRREDNENQPHYEQHMRKKICEKILKKRNPILTIKKTKACNMYPNLPMERCVTLTEAKTSLLIQLSAFLTIGWITGAIKGSVILSKIKVEPSVKGRCNQI